MSRWERGHDEPRLSTLARVADACSTSLTIAGSNTDDVVDRTQLRQNLALTPDQRLAAASNVATLLAGARRMNAPFDPAALFRVLDAHGITYVLIGGPAAMVRGSSAMTNDAVIVPAPDSANLSNLSAAITELGARLRVESDADGVAFDPHPALIASMRLLNLTTRFGDLDLELTPVGLEDDAELTSETDVFELGDVEVRVASLEHIIRSKSLADRPKDRATLPILHALRDEIDRAQRNPPT